MSPAWAKSRDFLNISIPVTTVFLVGLRPTISTSSLSCNLPRSTRPVTTVPRPEIVNTSSILIKNGLSKSLTGTSKYVSQASINFLIAPAPISDSSPSRALRAEPRMTGQSASKPYSPNNSRISISTKSNNSGSSTISHLLMNTRILGTPTWRASKICSLVWGIGPSVAETTRIAPSICAAPVIMFLT